MVPPIIVAMVVIATSQSYAMMIHFANLECVSGSKCMQIYRKMHVLEQNTIEMISSFIFILKYSKADCQIYAKKAHLEWNIVKLKMEWR